MWLAEDIGGSMSATKWKLVVIAVIIAVPSLAYFIAVLEG
jgi:hypothetical protein